MSRPNIKLSLVGMLLEVSNICTLTYGILSSRGVLRVVLRILRKQIVFLDMSSEFMMLAMLLTCEHHPVVLKRMYT